MRILVVEDEVALRDGLKFNFEQEGYLVDVAGDGVTALEKFETAEEPVDLVVLDLMLPGMSGYEICRLLREKNSSVPILVLSARTLSEDKAQAFDCGSDQYVTKPFQLPELLSRVRNLLERHRGHDGARADQPSNEPDAIVVGDVEVDLRRFEVRKGEETHSLTTMEQQLLKYFLENEGVVLSRADIMENVWGETADITTRSIDNFVLRLRRLIDKPDEPSHISSVRGTGYRFQLNALNGD